MSRLGEMQREFAKAIFDREGNAPDGLLHGRVAGSAPRKRFAVYRNNVIMSLTDVLKAYFPVVVRLVGDKFFCAMVREFILAHPPTSPILSRYGSGLADFLDEFEPVADLPYLSDVARLEWCQQRAYHAGDAQPLAPSALLGIPEVDVPMLRFDFHPSIHLLSSRHPVFSIWRTNTFDTDVKIIDGSIGAESAIVVRPQFDVLTLRLPEGAFELFETLMGNATLLSAAERAEERNPDLELFPALAILADLGALVGVKVSEAEPMISAQSYQKVSHERLH
ncbi:MAG: DNA-binding domain-containing protein [Alphaproteobacteria bacterium]|nr:DNA-binding domain-containing protein [Alphaproteobacteria bacterium]